MTAEIQMPQQHIAIISHSGLHEPWREIVHMGTHLVFPRSHYNHQATTDCFYFIDKGRVRLTYTNAAGEDHVVMFFRQGLHLQRDERDHRGRGDDGLFPGAGEDRSVPFPQLADP